MSKSYKPAFETRLNFFKTDLGKDDQLTEKLNKVYTENNGDWQAVAKTLTPKNGFKADVVKKLEFTHHLALWSNENANLVKALQLDDKINSMREVALNFDKASLIKKIKAENAIPETVDAETYATKLHRDLFRIEPTATIQRMAASAVETPIANKALSNHVAVFLNNQPETFNIKTTSIYHAFKSKDAFNGIAAELHEPLKKELKTLQRVVAISPVPEALPVLMKSNMTSALQVSDIPEESFVKSLAPELGDEGEMIAKQVHTLAVNARIRNEQTLMYLKEVGQGTGVAFIDKGLYSTRSLTKSTSNGAMQPMMYTPAQQKVNEELAKHDLSWDLLFGDADFCECGECTSVYSAAAYFVDLLQYLRNNNIDKTKKKTDPKDISNTPLEKLFNRRPDLGCLQLTCKNTNTILPYIDLVNEVMENYIVYHFPKPFNVAEDETSSELLAQPQHTEYEAYCILHKTVYPFTLPYHQPIDAARIFLEYLGTSRHELIDVFRSQRKDKHEDEADDATSEAPLATTDVERRELDQLHTAYLDRAVEAEFLGLTQEEYVILTKEAFVTKEYWDKQCRKNHTTEEYNLKIGLKPVHEYYGYKSEADLLSADESKREGLTFVKDQFLVRTGILYVDLVELLKTRSLNPNMPQGKALTIMESIRFSYRYMQTLVDNSAESPKAKYKRLIEMLTKAQPLIPMVEALINPDQCSQMKIDTCAETKDLENWIYCHFERVGKMIVLESGKTECQCPEGQFLWLRDGEKSQTRHFFFNDQALMMDDGKYFLDKECNVWADGRVPALDKDVREIVGKIDKGSGALVFSRGKFNDLSENESLLIQLKSGDEFIHHQDGKFTNTRTREPLGCVVPRQLDTCDLNKVRLVHLDGTSVTIEEYDRIQRFIRLWRKLGWTIDETDKALIGLGTVLDSSANHLLPSSEDCGNDCNDLFEESCDCESAAESTETCLSCEELSHANWEISPFFMSQLVSVKKLLDKTGLELIKLLTFWTNISTAGEKSLYKRLLLTHNILGMDKVFQADNNGHYLTKSSKIKAHVPVIMAAFNLTADDIDAIIEASKINDNLTLDNLSMLYRFRLLSKVLGLKIVDFINVLPVFGDPFQHAGKTLQFMDQWGRMEDAGFTHDQLNYIIRDHDNPKKGLAPDQRTILQLAKTLYDGLNAIDQEHKDIKAGDEANPEIVRAKAILLFDQAMVEKISGLLEGTNSFMTNAPKNLAIAIDTKKSLANRFKYDGKSGTIEIKGILTAAEAIDFISLSNDPKWADALIRIEKQQNKLFKQLMFDVVETEKAKSPERKSAVEGAVKILKAGDIKIGLDQIPEGQEDTNTAAKKAFAFLIIFMPYLRQQLTHRFIIDTLSGSVGLDREVTDVLLSEVLMSGSPSAYIFKTFASIKESSKPISNNWTGYLIPPSEGQYTFVIKDSDAKPSVILNGEVLEFQAQEDPTNEWWSTTQKLQAGKLYTFVVNGIDQKNVQWKTATSAISGIPSSALLPGFATENTTQAYGQLKKASLLVTILDLSGEELRHFNLNKTSFGNLDFNNITLHGLLGLDAYTRLRNALPETKTNILELFKWAVKPDDASKLSAKIEELTLWKKERIDKFITENRFGLLKPEQFQNEINLLKLQHALDVANKIGMDINLLFQWAKPTSNFKKCREIADSIQKAIRAKYKQEDWEQVVKPLNDKLRGNQKNALIAYLLQQPDLIKWGVHDADGLFEYFLIDVQMDACMETSRIKQAISSVQLFVQRCFLGLEEAKNGITPEVLSRDRWDWMQRYRVWEANRKVFLYPENWIESNLRDDKSSFFKEMEGELLQKDINKENVQDALKSYLYKVDEVANLEVVGLHIEMEIDENGALTNIEKKLHVFARTRSTPFFFYYRYFDMRESNWYPWEKMQVDVPSYDIEDPASHKITGNGCYLAPVVWNGRLLVFFPQFMKKTKIAPIDKITTSKSSSGNLEVPVSKPSEYMEIKMAWTEYRNGKWTPKQLSKDASSNSGELDLSKYKIIPSVFPEGVYINVDQNLDDNGTFMDTFNFDGSKVSLLTSAKSVLGANPVFAIKSFHKDASNALASLQFYQDNRVNNKLTFTDASSSTIVSNLTNYAGASFSHPYSKELIGKINTAPLDKFFKYNIDNTAIISDKDDAFGAFDHDKIAATPNSYHELKRAYSLYNWELFFHTPLMLADALSKSQQFEAAMRWYHFVFNPMEEGTDDKRFWMFTPFKEIDAQHILESIFNNLKPNTPDDAINEWRGNPFKPHLVARSRPVAYLKWVVMKYIDNLIAWGDYLFRQDTIESINQATQLYILAVHILGQRPQMIPKRGKIKPQTYNSLLHKWDAFSNAMVELELGAPYSNQTSSPVGNSNGIVGFANIFGFASSLYFCIPNNPKLMGYWDTIADRLFKIRHCENIQGVFRKLPLFEPPIDPALLVKAAAQGLSIDSVLNDLNSPMPNYRFYYLLQKALELCSELKSLGGGMLSALEKKDNESLSLLRAKHENTMHNLIMEIRKKQLEEAQSARDGLMQNRALPVHKMGYYLSLVGEDNRNIPQLDSAFRELTNGIAPPVDGSGLKLIQGEQEEMDKAARVADRQVDIGRVESLASVFHAIPNLTADGKPLGVGVGAMWGGSFLGNVTQAIAKWMQTDTNKLSFEGTSAGRKAGYVRQLQDRIMQANAEGYQIKQIDKQIASQDIRINIANMEIANQQKQIDNANEIEEFLKNKYTGAELYEWSKGNLKALYHQVYSLAYELAKKAEKVYCFERGLSNSNFIKAGYWDAGRDGLFAGEQLFVGLKQLEAAYQEQRGYDYEVTKHISLRQINPLALIQLKETGQCEFVLPEIIFDMDYPGHYKRRIKSLSLSVPCIAGPYTGLNATLQVLENKFRNTAIVKNANGYRERVEESDDRFQSFIIPINAIAASSGQNDSGMFELNFKDERYLPFEGAGVISKWRLTLPTFRQFDYDTISDVIMQVRYTSCEGGERLKKAAAENFLNFIKSNEELAQHEGLSAVVDLKHDLPTEWHRAMNPKENETERTLLIDNVQSFLPYFIRQDKDGKLRDLKKVKVTDIVLVTKSNLESSELVMAEGDNEITFADSLLVGDTKTFAIRDEEIKVGDWKLKIKNKDKVIDKAMMIMRFIIQ